MAVHLWRTDKVVDDLARGGVSEHDSAVYVLISLLVANSITWIAAWQGADHNWLFALEILITAAIVFLGVSECFQVNGGRDGIDFIKRFMCISVPVGIKVCLASLFLGHLMYWAYGRRALHTLFHDPGFVYDLWVLVLMTSSAFVTFWRIYVHLKRLRRAERSNLSLQSGPATSARPLS